MDMKKIDKIKMAVKANFESSPKEYQAFEDRHGFFRTLTSALLARVNVAAGAHILDVGCGTGASSLQLLEAIPHCRVWGLDNSAAMLDAARERIGESERLSFVEGDAAKLSEYFDFQFDAILYSASIFLIPDYAESLNQARSLLKKGGRVGVTFMDGVYDADGGAAFHLADQDAKTGVSMKKPVSWPEFEATFGTIYPLQVSWVEDFRLPEKVIQEFYSVPAMSAGLFPGIEYEERMKKVQRLFGYLPKSQIVFRWRLMVGEKGD
jgi:ubiquinone/menaquinone biosynthesis C-methylase UbiE